MAWRNAAWDPLPLGDGGDGTAQALCRALGGRPVRLRAHDALLAPVRAHAYALGRQGCARPEGAGPGGPGADTADRAGVALDLAGVCGLARLVQKGRPLRPLDASTYGLGEALLEAVRRVPAGPVWVGLGGSASTDGGLGLFASLGGRALDRHGRPVPPGGRGLAVLARLDADAVDPALVGRVHALVDVAAPLVGPLGSAARFAPQKGADPDTVRRLEAGLLRLAEVAERDLGASPAWRTAPGAGAAGGTGYMLVVLAHTPDVLWPGADTVLARTGFETRAARADAVLTAEGHLDRTTLQGKLPMAVWSRAARVGVPCVLLCAGAEPEAVQVWEKGGGVVAVALPDATGRAGPHALLRAARDGLARALGDKLR